MRSVAFTSVGDNVSADQFATDSLTAAADSGSSTALAQAHYAQGLALKSTSPVEATAELQRAADIARDAGNRWIQAFALTEVLWLEARQGRPREALARYIDVIDLWYRGGDWANQWLSLRHVFASLFSFGLTSLRQRSMVRSPLRALRTPYRSKPPTHSESAPL